MAGKSENEEAVAGTLHSLLMRDYKGLSSFYAARDELGETIGILMRNPALVNTRIVTALMVLALNSPFDDIDETDEPPVHAQNAQQDICFSAIGHLPRLAWVKPAGGAKVVQTLEIIADVSRDADIRQQAVSALFIMAAGRRPLAAEAVAALEQQGAQNSSALIRIIARDRLYSIASQFRPEIFDAAFRTQQAGTEDKNDVARRRAYAMLGNMVKTIPELDRDRLTGLTVLFQKAAAGDSDAITREIAIESIKNVQERLNRPGMTPLYPVPRSPNP